MDDRPALPLPAMGETIPPPPASAAPGPGRAASGSVWMRLATYASVAVALTLIGLKLGAFALTGSIAMLASLVDSGLDLIASLVTLFAVRHALVPADAEHRFGHGKAEALAGMTQAIIITGSALFILFEAISHIVEPEPVQHSTTGMVVIGISIALTLALVLFQGFVIRRTGSLAISADELHYQGDLLTNAGVVVALVLSGVYGVTLADPLIGLAIAGYIAWAAFKILRGSWDQLMDREMSDADRARIAETALAHPAVLALHDLRTRQSGQASFIQFHLELDGAMTLMAAHRISDEVERAIQALYPEAEVFIHQDPAGLERLTRLERS